ncbi:citrate lyase holo-[acyl-carrier protein] synthase [Lachnospiraceae bacterium OttesenSCG-928-D06]|nr:citrate lyase holo-[acyl-carrier protein] synthase [Lachnospiraceae bacterium OttesenSCG-928-D06]
MGQEVKLTDVLRFREEKAALQRKLNQNQKGCISLSLGMNIPGSIKNTPDITQAFAEGCRLVEFLLMQNDVRIKEEAIQIEKAGYVAVFCVEGIDAFKIKKQTIFLEETHPLGRIYDIDVWDDNAVLISRKKLSARRRTCLICKGDAKVCGRSRVHTVEELQEKVFGMIKDWKENESKFMEKIVCK